MQVGIMAEFEPIRLLDIIPNQFFAVPFLNNASCETKERSRCVELNPILDMAVGVLLSW